MVHDTKASPTWERVEQLMDEVLELPPGERTAWLEETARRDLALFEEVRELLSAADATGGPIDHPFLPSQDCPPDFTGRLAGSWRLLELLGEGGMGCVYLAERADGAFEMQAAVKLIPLAAKNPKLRSRFQRERHALARLEHPRIARLLDAGITEDHIPFLVMEYADGVPIDQWCEDRMATPLQVADLLLQVCDAVAYAHGRFVLHRDIKPTNVFVTPEGRVKLLDFSIAAIIEDTAPDEAVAAQRGGHPCTPSFAAPEQIRGETLTVATDVYGIGALAYRLLAGRPPRDLALGASVSSLISGLDEILPSPSKIRGDRRMAGDLDAIVLKAVDPKPSQRFGSVVEMADDLRRHRENRPIRARRTPEIQRAIRAIRRHPARAAATAAIALATLTLAGTEVWRAHTAEISRQKAEQAAVFLQDVLTAAGPDAVQGVDVHVTELLDRAVVAAELRLKDQPGVQATILEPLAEGLSRMGLWARAAEVQEKALALRREDPDSTSEQLLGSIVKTVQHHANVPGMPDPDRALNLLREGYRVAHGMDRGWGTATARVLHLEAEVISRIPGSSPERLQEARSVIRRSQELAEKGQDGGLLVDILRTRAALATDPEETQDYIRQALDQSVEVYGEEDFHTLTQRNDLALSLESSGQGAQAQHLLRQVLESYRHILGTGHPQTVAVANNLAGMLRDGGEFAQAEALYREVLDLRLRTLPEDSVQIGYTLYGLGRSIFGQNRPAEAEDYLARAASILERHGLTRLAPIARQWQAKCLIQLGRRQESLDLLDQSTREINMGADPAKKSL